MKNLVYIFALLLCASLFSVSCSKVETPEATGNGKSGLTSSGQSATNTSSGKQHNGGLKSATGFGTNWLFDDERVKCWPSPLDCYDVITVKPTQSEILKMFEEAVNGDASDIKDFFTTQQWQLLFPDFDGTVNLIKLQSGLYDMIMKTDDKNISYYAAGSELPLTLKNEEFVLRIDKSDLEK